jgi:hypothetical protein
VGSVVGLDSEAAVAEFGAVAEFAAVGEFAAVAVGIGPVVVTGAVDVGLGTAARTTTAGLGDPT